MERLNYMIKVMQAFAAGEAIQSMNIDFCTPWKVESTPNWDWSTFDYRIKPRSKKVYFEYEDFLNEIKKNGLLVRSIKYRETLAINRLTDMMICTTLGSLSYELFCQRYTRLDGTKFEREV